MIRINLLPIRKIKRRAQLRKELFIAAALLVCIVTGLGLYHMVLGRNISALNTEIAALKKEKEKYNPIIKEIAELKKVKEGLESKLDIIKKLKRGSQIAVRVLDRVATLVPSNRMWLRSISQKDSKVSLEGTALDNATIAQFMNNLGNSGLFTEAELSSSSMTSVAERKLKSFSLSLGVQSASEDDKSKDEKGKKK